jgi:hypothetical protein
MEKQMSAARALFDDIVSSIASAPATVARLQNEAYVELLKRQDWSYEFSDDHSVYCRGRDSLKTLKTIQRDADPTGEVWNQYAPAEHKLGGVAS